MTTPSTTNQESNNNNIKKEEKKSIQRAVIEMIMEYTDQRNLIVVHKSFKLITGSYNSAVMLSQLLYWSDKGKYEWIYKNYKDWFNETGITQGELTNAKRNLKKLGIIDWQVKKANGVPTTYYKINFETLAILIQEYTKKTMQEQSPEQLQKEVKNQEFNERLNAKNQTTKIDDDYVEARNTVENKETPIYQTINPILSFDKLDFIKQSNPYNTYTTSNITLNIYKHWNLKNILECRKLKPEIKKLIEKSLEDNTEKEILEAIDNYAIILNDEQYYYSYRFDIGSFLTLKKNAGIRNFEKFKNIAKPFDSYLIKKQAQHQQKKEIRTKADFGYEKTTDEKYSSTLYSEVENLF